jgi:hypothetical protein
MWEGHRILASARLAGNRDRKGGVCGVVLKLLVLVFVKPHE